MDILFCGRCEEEKPSSEYRRDRSRKTGFQVYCKSCSSKLCRELDKRPERVEYLNAKSRARVADTRAKFDSIKLFLGCACCSEKHLSCMDFHHIESSEKELSLSASKKHSWSKLVLELVKCVCVCANCHRKIHAGEDMGSLSCITKEQISKALATKMKGDPNED